MLEVDAAPGQRLGVVVDQALDLLAHHPLRQVERMALAELVEEGLLALLVALLDLALAQAADHRLLELVETGELGVDLRREGVVERRQVALLDAGRLDPEGLLVDDRLAALFYRMLGRMLVAAREGGLLAGREAGEGERELLPDVGVADLDVDGVGLRFSGLLALLAMSAGERGDLGGHQVAARRRPLDRHPAGHPAPDVLEGVLDLDGPRVGRRVRQVEVPDVAQLDLRPRLDRGDEGQRLAGL